MVLRMDFFVSPGRPRIKSPWYDQAKLVAGTGKVQCTLDGCALLEFLRILRIARTNPTIKQPAARFFHSLQRVIVGRDARVAGPGEIEGLQAFRTIQLFVLSEC